MISLIMSGSLSTFRLEAKIEMLRSLIFVLPSSYKNSCLWNSLTKLVISKVLENILLNLLRAYCFSISTCNKQIKRNSNNLLTELSPDLLLLLHEDGKHVCLKKDV